MGAKRPPRRGRPFGGKPRPGVLGGNFQDILDQLREENIPRPGIRPPRDRDIVIDDGPGMGGPGINPPRSPRGYLPYHRGRRDRDIVIEGPGNKPKYGEELNRERGGANVRERSSDYRERMRRKEERMRKRAERKRRRAEFRRKRRRKVKEDMPRPVSRRFAPGERRRRRRRLPKDMPRPVSRRFAPGEEPN